MLEGRTKACELLIGIDYPLFNNIKNSTSEARILAETHVQELNKIFAQQVFIDDYSSYYFRLKRIEIVYDSCKGFGFENDYQNCTEQRSKFLNAFDKSTDTTDFCLAYMLTYRDFHNGTAGLASIGTVCQPNHNSGFVTMLNYGQLRPLDESFLTFAHEVGHSFNAIHDSTFEDDEECFHKGFIMEDVHNISDTSNADNKDKFSPCSLKAMKARLDSLGSEVGFDDCFKYIPYIHANTSTAEVTNDEIKFSICGNGIVEDGEMCDCGFTDVECNDPCCYPAFISEYERSQNSTAKYCQRTDRRNCLTRPGLMFGIFVPWTMIFVIVFLTCLLLVYDWRHGKTCFTHIASGNIRIVNQSSVR